MRTRFAIPATLMLLTILISVTSLALAGPLRAPQQQAQTINIGVLGASDSDTAQGVQLAVQRINANGPIAGPGNVTYTLNVMTQDVKTAEDVTNALGQFRQANVAAIFGPDDPLAAKSSAALTASGIPIFTGAT